MDPYRYIQSEYELERMTKLALEEQAAPTAGHPSPAPRARLTQRKRHRAVVLVYGTVMMVAVSLLAVTFSIL